jgi:hypothetical protein
MKLFSKLLVLLALAGLVACKEEFVEVSNPNALSTDNYPASMADLEQLLTGVYGTQHAFGLFGHDMLGKNLYCWDHTLDMSWQGTPTWIALAQNNTQPNDEFLAETWRDAWKGVQRSNTLLTNLAAYRQRRNIPRKPKPSIKSKGRPGSCAPGSTTTWSTSGANRSLRAGRAATGWPYPSSPRQPRASARPNCPGPPCAKCGTL